MTSPRRRHLPAPAVRRRRAIRAPRRTALAALAACCALASATLLAQPPAPTPAPRHGGGAMSFSRADREADVQADAWFARAGKKLKDEDSLLVGAPFELVVRASWAGGAEVASSASLLSMDLELASFDEPAEGDPPTPDGPPWPAAMGSAQPDEEADDAGRWFVEWRFPLVAGKEPGLARAKGMKLAYKLAGHDIEPPPLSVDSASAVVEAEPTRWLFWISVVLFGSVGAAGAGWGLWTLFQKLKRDKVLRLTSPMHSSDDPTPFERVHAELASCEMKAHVEDFDGFFRKFHPILYNFAAATEGPAVNEMGPDDLAAYFVQTGYEEKTGQRLVSMLKICERYWDAGDAPTTKECLAMTGALRQMATVALRRSPKGLNSPPRRGHVDPGAFLGPDDE